MGPCPRLAASGALVNRNHVNPLQPLSHQPNPIWAYRDLWSTIFFYARSLNSSHQTLHFRHMNFYFFQRTQISLNRFLSIFGSFQLCFLLFFLKIRVFILLLFLSEDVDLPESFYFFQRTQISLNFLLPFWLASCFPKATGINSRGCVGEMLLFTYLF